MRGVRWFVAPAPAIAGVWSAGAGITHRAVWSAASAPELTIAGVWSAGGPPGGPPALKIAADPAARSHQTTQ